MKARFLHLYFQIMHIVDNFLLKGCSFLKDDDDDDDDDDSSNYYCHDHAYNE